MGCVQCSGDGPIHPQSNGIAKKMHSKWTKYFNKLRLNTDLNLSAIVMLARGYYQSLKPKNSLMVTYFSPKNMHRRTKKYCEIEFFEYDEDIDMTEAESEIVHLFSDAAVAAIDSEPVVDFETYYDDEWHAYHEIYKVYGDALPHYEVQWHDWRNLNTLSQFAFAGIGSWYLTGVSKDSPCRFPEARYQIDLTEWDRYSVREGFETYGVAAYFNSDRMPVGYYWPKEDRLVFPDDPLFFRMGVLLRAALHICITLRDHLFFSHWVVSNTVVLASERCLDVQHPIRRLVKPHTYGSAHVHLLGAVTLSPYGGIASRLFGLDPPGWAKACGEGINAFKYESLSERFNRSGLPSTMREHMPVYQDGMDLWNEHEEYVEEYLKIFYPKEKDLLLDMELRAYWEGVKNFSPNKLYQVGDLTQENLVKHLTHFLFWVTGGHSFVGSTAEYLRSPYAFPGKLRVGQDMADVQTMLLQNALISLTTGIQPMLVSDWRHIHSYPNLNQPERTETKAKVLANLEHWQSNLKLLSDKVRSRNRVRLHPFDKMQPDLLESSIAV